MDTPEVLNETQKFYRARVYNSWTHQFLYDRHMADITKPAHIGYAPGGWDTTVRYLRKQGASDADMIRAGVAFESDSGRLLDVLRDRLVFPVRDDQGELVGFLGRAQNGTDDPKYINTPATELFQKSRLLYGLGEQRKALRAGATPVIVEGPFDRWAVHHAQEFLHQKVAGLAPCGTAFTSHQLDTLTRASAAPIVFAFDSDGAGQKAMMRAWKTCEGLGNVDLKVLRMPAGHDPASLHPKALASSIARAKSMAVAVAEVRIAEWGRARDNPIRNVQIVREIAERDLLRVPPDRLKEWISAIGKPLGMRPNNINEIVFSDTGVDPPSAPHIPTPTRQQNTRPTARVNAAER